MRFYMSTLFLQLQLVYYEHCVFFLWYNEHNEFELSKGASKMKKRILYFLVLLCLLFSGCGKEEKRNEEVVTTEEVIPERQ